MPKRSTLPPPFPLTGSGRNAWRDLQIELGGMRGKGYSTAQIWKLAQVAEHSAFMRRGKLPEELVEYVKETRREFGLPELPA